MAGPLSADERLDRDFLEIRARLIDVAAALDRIERGAGAGGVRSDRRLAQIREAVAILGDDAADRAERVQMVFSDPYEEDWRRG